MNQFDQQQDFQDKTLNCKDCPDTFVFSVGEQKFFAEKQLTDPVRCKPCRAAKKAQRDQGGGGGFRSAPAAPPQQPVNFDATPPRDGGDGRRQKNGGNGRNGKNDGGGRRGRNNDWNGRRGGDFDD